MLDAPLMTAEICHLYHWHLDYVLAMPVTQFFLMLNRGRRLLARNYSVLADLAMIPACKVEFYENRKRGFEAMWLDVVEGLPDDPPTQHGINPVMDGASDIAKYGMFALATMVKRGLGYGG